MNEVIDLTGEEGEEEDLMSISFQGRADDVPDNDSDYEGTVVKVFSFIHDDFDTGQDLVSNGYRKGGLLTMQGDQFDWMFHGSLEDWGECSSRTETNEVEACDSDEYVEGVTEESEDETIEIPKPNQKNLQVDFRRSSVIGKDEHQSNAWNKLVAGLQMCHDNTEIEPRNRDDEKCEQQDKYQENISDNDSGEVERQNQNGPPKTPEIHFTDLNNPDTEESCPATVPGMIREYRTGGSVDMEQAPVRQGTQTKRGDNASQRQGKLGKFSCYMCLFTASTVVAVVGHLQDHHKQDFARYEVVKLFLGKSKMQRKKYCIFPSSKGMRSSHRVNIFKSKVVKTNKIFPKNKRVISNTDKFSNKTDDMVECCSIRHSSVIDEKLGASEMSEPNIHTESQKNETSSHPSPLQTSSHQDVSNCSEKSTSHTLGDWSNVSPLIHNSPAELAKNSICVGTHWERVEPPDNIAHLGSHCSSISQARDSVVEEPVDNSVSLRVDGTSYIRDFDMLDSVDICTKTGPGTEPEINPKESFLREGPLTQFKEVARELPDETVKELACFFCSFVGNNSEMLQIHNQQVHRWENLYGEESQVVTNYNVAQLKSFACWLCPFRTTLFEKFVKHKVRYHPLDTMCDTVNQDIAAGKSESTGSEEGISDCDSPLNSDPLSVLREPSHRKDILNPLPVNGCLRSSSREACDTSVPQEPHCLKDILDPLPEYVCLRGPMVEDTDKRVQQEHPCLKDILDPSLVNGGLGGSSRDDSETSVRQELHCQKDILDPSLVNGNLGESFGKDASLDNDTGVQKPTYLLQGILTDKQRQGDINSRGALEECPSESVSDNQNHAYVLHQTDSKYSKMKEHLEKNKMVCENEQTPKRLEQRDHCDSSLSPEDVIELFRDINEYTRVHPIQNFDSKNLPRGPRCSKLRAVKRKLFSNCQAAACKASNVCMKGRFKQVLTWDSSHSRKQSCSNPKYKKQSGTGTVSLNQNIVFNDNYQKTHLGQQCGLTSKKTGKNEQEIITNTIWSHVDTENKLLKRRGRLRKNRSPEHNPDVRADSLKPKLKKLGRSPKPKEPCNRQMTFQKDILDPLPENVCLTGSSTVDFDSSVPQEPHFQKDILHPLPENVCLRGPSIEDTVKRVLQEHPCLKDILHPLSENVCLRGSSTVDFDSSVPQEPHFQEGILDPSPENVCLRGPLTEHTDKRVQEENPCLKDILIPLPENVCLRGSSTVDFDSSFPQEPHFQKDILDPLPENVCLRGSSTVNFDSSVPQEPHAQEGILNPLPENVCLRGSSRTVDSDSSVPQEPHFQKDILNPLPENVCLRGSSTVDFDSSVPQEPHFQKDILHPLPENVCLRGSSTVDFDSSVPQEPHFQEGILDPLPEHVCLRGPLMEDTNKRVQAENPCLKDILDPLPENVCLRGSSRTVDFDSNVPKEPHFQKDILPPLPESVCLRGPSIEDTDKRAPQEPHCRKDILDPSLLNGGLGKSSIENTDKRVPQEPHFQEDILDPSLVNGGLGGSSRDDSETSVRQELHCQKAILDPSLVNGNLRESFGKDASFYNDTGVQKPTYLLQGILTDKQRQGDVNSRGALEECPSESVSDNQNHAYVPHQTDSKYSKTKEHLEKIKMVCENEQMPKRLERRDHCDSSQSPENVIEQSCSNPKYKKQSGTGTVSLNQNIVFNDNYQKTHLGQHCGLTTKKTGKNEQEIITNTIWSHVDTENKLLKRRGRLRKNRSPEHNPDVRADSLKPKLKKRGRSPKPKEPCNRQMTHADSCCSRSSVLFGSHH